MGKTPSFSAFRAFRGRSNSGTGKREPEVGEGKGQRSVPTTVPPCAVCRKIRCTRGRVEPKSRLLEANR